MRQKTNNFSYFYWFESIMFILLYMIGLSNSVKYYRYSASAQQIIISIQESVVWGGATDHRFSPAASSSKRIRNNSDVSEYQNYGKPVSKSGTASTMNRHKIVNISIDGKNQIEEHVTPIKNLLKESKRVR